MNSISLTPEQLNTLQAYLKSAADKTTASLDPANPEEKAVIDAMMTAANKTEKDFPHLFSSMQPDNASKQKQASQAGADALDSVHVVDSGATASGKATASIWASSNSKALTNGGTLMVFDADSGELLAQGSNSAVKSGFLSCSTQAATAMPAGKNLSLLYVGHVVDIDGSSRHFAYSNKNLATGIGNASAKKMNNAQMMVTASAGMSGIQCQVDDPVIKHAGNTAVQIAVGRVANPPTPIPPTTDYIYIQPQNEPDSNIYLICPFKGNVPLSGIIDLSGITASAVTTNIIFTQTNGQSVYVNRNPNYTSDAKFIAALTASGNVLTWNYPYDGKTYQTTDSIVYDPCSLVLEKTSYFYYAFNAIPFTNGETAPPFYVCSTGSPEEKSVNCTEISPLYYWWHCVAAGTLVTLDDGSQKPIEELNETYRVKTANGNSLQVEATVQGTHTSDPANNQNGIYKLVTANGKTLLATESHMVFMSDNKCRMMCHIAAGDPIMTEDGASTVQSCEPVKGNEMFYGLLLGNSQERQANDFSTNQASYYANGILSGDQEVMRQNSDEAYHDLQFMLPRIETPLHQDYSSALQQKRY